MQDMWLPSPPPRRYTEAEVDITEDGYKDTVARQQRVPLRGPSAQSSPTPLLYDESGTWPTPRSILQSHQSSPRAAFSPSAKDSSDKSTRPAKKRKLSVNNQPRPPSERKRVAETPIDDVDHRVVLRRQLISAFLESQCTKTQGIVQVQTTTIASWLGSLAESDRQTPLLERAIGAFCLASLSAVHNDEQSKWVARTSYGPAVTALGKALSRSPKKSDAREQWLTIMAMRLLSIVEMFDGISMTTPDESMTLFDRRAIHVKGVQSYLQAIGPATFAQVCKCATPVEFRLFNYLRFQAVLMNLVDRKATPFGSRRWLALDWDCDTDEYRYHAFSQLISIAARLPALLEKCDNIDRKVLSAESKLKQELRRLRTDLDAWLHKHPCQPEPLSVDEEGKTIREVFDEGSLVHDVYWSNNKKHSYCWFFCIMVDCTLLKIGARSPHPQPSSRGIQLDIKACMYSICRIEPTSSTGVGSWFLMLASCYFKHVGLEEEYQWCVNVKRGMDQQNEMPQVGRMSCVRKWHPWILVSDAASPATICLPDQNDNVP